MGIALTVLFGLVIAALPLAIFNHKTWPGKLLRLYSGLLSLMLFWNFSEAIATEGRKSVGAVVIMAGWPYFAVFVAQIFRRRGLPIVETFTGLIAFRLVFSTSGNFWTAGATAVVAILVLYGTLTRYRPIASSFG